MATPEDYIGKRFGLFEIGQIIGEGLESEVYLCRHLINGKSYVLKLFVDDDILWDSEPLLPPLNARLLKVPLHKVYIMAKGSGGYQRITPNYLTLFAQNQYLRPLTILLRAKGSWSFEDLLNYRPKVMQMLPNLHLYNNAGYAMFTDLLNIASDESGIWETKWGRLRGGDQLMSLLKPVAHNLPNRQLFDLISRPPSGGVEFAENHLLWLAAACISDHLSADGFNNTLMCPFFRLNIATDEVLQFIDLHRALSSRKHYSSNDIDRTMTWIEVILSRLFAEPFDPESHPENFEMIDSVMPNLDDRTTVLMEHQGEPLTGLRWGA